MKRILAYFLDGIISTILIGVSLVIFILLGMHIEKSFFYYNVVIISYVYIFVCDYFLKGKTIGKWICGTEAFWTRECSEHLKYSVIHALWRTVFYFVPLLGVIVLWLGKGKMPYELFFKKCSRKSDGIKFRRNKIYILITGLVVVIVLINILHTMQIKNKEEKSPIFEIELTDLSEQQGFEIEEISGVDENIITTLEICLDNDIKVIYKEFNSEENAMNYFMKLFEEFSQKNDVKMRKSSRLKKYSMITTTGDELYQVSVRVKNTLFEYVGGMKDKKIVDDFINMVGY